MRYITPMSNEAARLLVEVTLCNERVALLSVPATFTLHQVGEALAPLLERGASFTVSEPVVCETLSEASALALGLLRSAEDRQRTEAFYRETR